MVCFVFIVKKKCDFLGRITSSLASALVTTRVTPVPASREIAKNVHCPRISSSMDVIWTLFCCGRVFLDLWTFFPRHRKKTIIIRSDPTPIKFNSNPIKFECPLPTQPRPSFRACEHGPTQIKVDKKNQGKLHLIQTQQQPHVNSIRG